MSSCSSDFPIFSLYNILLFTGCIHTIWYKVHHEQNETWFPKLIISADIRDWNCVSNCFGWILRSYKVYKFISAVLHLMLLLFGDRLQRTMELEENCQAPQGYCCHLSYKTKRSCFNHSVWRQTCSCAVLAVLPFPNSLDLCYEQWTNLTRYSIRHIH